MTIPSSMTDNSSNNLDFHNLLTDWNERWQSGEFPRRSEQGRPVEFRYVVEPLVEKHCPPLRFGFLEISGEDFKQLAEQGTAVPRLLPSIDGFLNKPGIKLAFLFVCQGEDVRGDDYLFYRFLNYIRARVDPAFRGSYSAALVIANPEACKERLALVQGRPARLDEPLDEEAFLRMITPQTAAELSVLGKRATRTPFSVGTVVQKESGARIIQPPAFEDARAPLMPTPRQATQPEPVVTRTPSLSPVPASGPEATRMPPTHCRPPPQAAPEPCVLGHCWTTYTAVLAAIRANANAGRSGKTMTG